MIGSSFCAPPKKHKIELASLVLFFLNYELKA
jgi:hypothetical protein